MNSKSKLFFYNLIIIISIFIGAFGVHRLFMKPDLPFQINTYENKIIAKEQVGEIDSGAVLVEIDSKPIYSEFQLEFLLDNRSQGDTVTLVTSKQNDNKINRVILVPPYKNLQFIIISFLIGFTFLMCSVFVINKKVNDPSARVLFWVLLLFALAAVTSPGKISTDVISYIIRITHALSFTIGISAFLHFSVLFPNEKKNAKKIFMFFHIPIVLISILLSFAVYKAIDSEYYYWLKNYEILWKILYLMLVVSMLSGVLVFYKSERKLKSKEDKAKVKWILWGISAGVLPYLVLYIIPKVLGLAPIPEEYPFLLLIIVPVSFAVAVVKFRLFDIELLIKRSIVYSILTGFILFLYLIIVALLSTLLNELAGNIDRFISIIAAIVIAFIFNPARIKIQKYVDKLFYREKYDFEQAVSSFTKDISECSTLSQLGQKIISVIEKHIPINKLGVLVLDENGKKLKIIAQKDIDKTVKFINKFEIINVDLEYNKPFALESAIQPDVEVNTSLSEILTSLELCAAIPLELTPGSLAGAIVLGNKLSGLRYSYNDFELLKVFASESAIAVSKLQFQEQLVLKEIEKQKLEELNSLKSFFVSSVSHDLKTPVTSIKMFTEMLKNNDLPDNKKNEYFEIIEGESENLTHLIENILNISKMESGTKTYNFELLNFYELICKIINQMNYRLKINKFKFHAHFADKDVKISGDEDAISSAVINLLNNSIKYSSKVREITVNTGKENGYIFINVTDKGIGIPEEQLNNIFLPYFRVTGISSKIKGTGLGLSIVKHVMDTHKGKIKISSTPGDGTSITLLFPLNTEELNN